MTMLIAGNWKMYKGPEAAGTFCRELRAADLPDNVDVVVCPPFVSLAAAVQSLAGTEIGVFAQNCHWDVEGAFTGEVSAPMLQEARRVRDARRALRAAPVVRRDGRARRAACPCVRSMPACT